MCRTWVVLFSFVIASLTGCLCELPALSSSEAAVAEIPAPPPEQPAPVVKKKKKAAPAPVVKKKIVLRGVNFGFDSAAIRDEDQVLLDAASEALKDAKGAQVLVGGHTDSTGPEAYNQDLSLRRAQSVKDYLVASGLDGSRFETTGFGETQPVADNGTSDGRKQNRRVELSVKE